ncbi:MAG TPA: SDR family NAD(P)-dependent oxidoreductase [Vicinamibacterales bacterium]|nr:SDR family NAD(P)-dependent oxidoreductase [Vicinamibacterales bacterium]
MNLTGKAALITGAKRIGATVALELAKRGADVAVSYSRSKTEADEVVAAIHAVGRRAVALQTDLADPSQCARVITQAVGAFGRLDILILMASVYEATAFDQLDLAAWDRTINIDLRSAFLCAVAAVPHMRQHGGGRIITFSDWLSRSGRPRYEGWLPYYVAKGGVMALTEALALELAKDNILVNAIAPGPILAPPTTSADDHQKIADATPLGRWGGGGEIAKAVLAFIESDFITGETLRVDGGRHVK